MEKINVTPLLKEAINTAIKRGKKELKSLKQELTLTPEINLFGEKTNVENLTLKISNLEEEILYLKKIIKQQF